MRFIYSILFLGTMAVATNAQEDYSGAFEEEPAVETKRVASDYFPKAGDIGIGFDAAPFLNYLGNAFNGTQGNTLKLGDNTLYFRYFLTDRSAARLALRINSNKEVNNFYVADDAAQVTDPLSQNQVEDRRTELSNTYELRAGYQAFRGRNRLRGFFGGDLFFHYNKYSEAFEYGNNMNELNPSPTTAAYAGSPARRPLNTNSGATVSLGLGAFTGAEYYIMPNVCIGAELGLIYAQSLGSQRNAQYETMVNSLYVVEDVEIAPGDRSRNLDTSFPSSYGNLYLMIQF
ncbi:hypothetical protein [Geofilum rubicundum]|uniref:Outer membrane protein beta-barrel domain-containing protein n=1 Tax=Geofilum rubicundum JCM 15548 TaxID=1236989 RepID=A0A0E9LVQ4_9BACT|nr:hypothetical protein [Geofilum rubicundum]GAO29373.1 hypothetical protein JCM15548_11552 [Geofilum rubicundum JCM 15548]